MQRRLLRSRQPLASAVLAMVFSLVGTSALLAQSTALLRGAITDEQGSIVPGAMVAVRNEANGPPHPTRSVRTWSPPCLRASTASR
jgi:hypothetical protein